MIEGRVGQRLNALLQEAGLEPIDEAAGARFERFYSLIIRWNVRLNLTAIRDEEGIISRHFIESIILARSLPTGITTLLDFGSGAGLPGVPIAVCRPDIALTLAESQGKKAAFLHEAVRALELSVAVHAGRAERLIERFDCVTMRAVDRMSGSVHLAVQLLAQDGWLALMTTATELDRLKVAAGVDLLWREPISLPGGRQRLIALGTRNRESSGETQG
jgi:16S rRNA (guanine527-N7)-methyltransferase